MTQEEIIKNIRLLKATRGISFKQVAEHLNMSYNGFMNVMGGYKGLGTDRLKKLEEYINAYKEV